MFFRRTDRSVRRFFYSDAYIHTASHNVFDTRRRPDRPPSASGREIVQLKKDAPREQGASIRRIPVRGRDIYILFPEIRILLQTDIGGPEFRILSFILLLSVVIQTLERYTAEYED